MLTNEATSIIITYVVRPISVRKNINGGIAQLARAFGSYPKCRWFKSYSRYQYGPVVKRLRHRPFTAVTRVRVPSGSPEKNEAIASFFFYLFRIQCILLRFSVYITALGAYHHRCCTVCVFTSNNKKS